MLAALYVNFFTPRGRPGELWTPERRRTWEKLEDTIKRKRYDRERMRAHLQDTLDRLKKRHEVAERMEEEFGPSPDVSIIVTNDYLILQLHALYMEYLDDEEIIIFAAAVL